MPFCTQCAHAIPDGSRFCPACGTPVVSVVAPAPAAAAPARGAAAPAAAPPPPTSESSAETVPSDSSPSSSGRHGRFDPGTRLGTRYRVVALLGRGGMGEVYRADDLELGQAVALKFLPAGVAAHPAELAQFRTEVRSARLIAHPNVCRVYDIGEVDGHVFLSMEYIDGEDLASVLRRMGRPTSDKAVEIARQICLGLAAAHEAGMLHRDLKPANVMIDGRGRARITDFGLAGLADELARGGQLAGTPAYMAPEQIAHGRVSARSDVYSLGLVLYEVFTGKRVFDAANMADLRQMHDSDSITTPSDLARDIDPAVERVIMHCLERDPDARPPSAYAVLAALPGGDPLAAAMAAGETPSPELVANAGERGTLSPGAALGYVSIGLIALTLSAGIIGPELRAVKQPAPVLSVRAADLLSATGAIGSLPVHSAEGFELMKALVRQEIKSRGRRSSAESPIFFWRRWSPQQIEPVDIHNEMVNVDDPPLVGAGGAAVLLDPMGRLIALRANPPDSLRVASAATPAWSAAWAAMGLDSTAFTSVPLIRPVPATCDTAAAWTGPLPWSGERVTIQAGAARGHLAYLTIVHPWGATAAPLDSLAADLPPGARWGRFVFSLLPLLASLYFGLRNLRLGRGDRRGATRIALFVLVMNLVVAMFGSRLSQAGLVGVGNDLSAGRALGHALIHALGMWLAYIALEPYVRRLWPRILVSWARLISGRFRDPLVGRDLLIGAMAGLLLVALTSVGSAVAERYGWVHVPTQLNTYVLMAMTSLSHTAAALAYASSVCVLTGLASLVMVVLVRLISGRTWIAIVTALTAVSAMIAISTAPDAGWPLAIFGALISVSAILVLMQFGLLAGVTTLFVMLVTGMTVTSLDLSSWYADRALLPGIVVIGLLVYGAATALAGKPILGDPLRDGAGRPGGRGA